MTEEEFEKVVALIKRRFDLDECTDEDVVAVIAYARSLTIRLAVAQGTATAETHRAERAEARIAVLEREALENARTVLEAIAMRTSLAVSRDRVRVVEAANLELENLNRATLHNVEGVVRERDALAKLVECAPSFRFADVGIQRWVDKWSLNGVAAGRVVCEVFDTRDEAIARARELAKEET